MYSGITSGRVLSGELLYTKILEVNLFAFAYRLFRRDFSPLDGTYCMGTHSFLQFFAKRNEYPCNMVVVAFVGLDLSEDDLRSISLTLLSIHICIQGHCIWQ